MGQDRMSREEQADLLTREELLARAKRDGDETSSDWEVVTRLLANRYSCRGFRADAVPHETIERILALGQLTASWCNAQPWQAIVTEGEGTQRFRAAMFAYASENPGIHLPEFPFPERYTGVYDARRKETGWALYESVGVQRGDRAASLKQGLENFRLFGAPHVLILTTEADLGVYGSIDCGIYLGNLLMLMQSLGIATIAQAALANYAPFIRSYFDIPEQRRILVGLSFGYPDDEHPANNFRTRRADVQDVAQWVRE